MRQQQVRSAVWESESAEDNELLLLCDPGQLYILKTETQSVELYCSAADAFETPDRQSYSGPPDRTGLSSVLEPVLLSDLNTGWTRAACCRFLCEKIEKKIVK